MLGDHAQRLRRKELAQSDEAAIRELEQHAMPLMLAVKAAAAVAMLYFAVHLLYGHIEQYLDMAAQQEALVQCLNGRFIGIGDDAMMSCRVQQLIPDMPEVQS